MDAASMEEESSDRSIQPASPDEQQSSKKEIQGEFRAHLFTLVWSTLIYPCQHDMESLQCSRRGLRMLYFASQALRLVCAGNTEANKQVKVPEDHDSSSGTENPNKGKNDAKGVTEQVKEKLGSSSEQKPESNGEHLDPHSSEAVYRTCAAQGRPTFLLQQQYRPCKRPESSITVQQTLCLARQAEVQSHESGRHACCRPERGWIRQEG